MSRFIFAGNEIIPGTVVMTADGTITPKDDLRVILNISGGGTVSLSDGTDTTQRMEIVNVNADSCSFTYKGTGGSTTASIYTNTGIRLLWVGSYWETSMSTAVTGIDDNNQPFAFNIDSLAKPDGVANITGTDADGVPFDVGVGQLVTVAEEESYSTTEVKTSKTWIDGKPIYRKTFVIPSTTPTANTNSYLEFTKPDNFYQLINSYGNFISGEAQSSFPFPYDGTWYARFLYTPNQHFALNYMVQNTATIEGFVTLEYTKTE